MLYIHSVYYDDFNPAWSVKESVTDYAIFLFMVQGSALYILNGEELELHKGDMLYIPAGTLRAAHCMPGSQHQKYAILFNFNEPDPTLPFAESVSRKLRSRSQDYMKQRFSILHQQWLGKLPYYASACAGIALELLAIAAREAKNAKFPTQKLALVTFIQQYILEHYRESIRISELAKMADRTPNYVTNTFREVTGQTPIDYLHSVQVSAARDLLLNERITIAEAADRLGFCDQAYFNRVFKKVTGTPPSSLLKERT